MLIIFSFKDLKIVKLCTFCNGNKNVVVRSHHYFVEVYAVLLPVIVCYLFAKITRAEIEYISNMLIYSLVLFAILEITLFVSDTRSCNLYCIFL